MALVLAGCLTALTIPLSIASPAVGIPEFHRHVSLPLLRRPDHHALALVLAGCLTALTIPLSIASPAVGIP
ncbi:hypothetical protein C7E17_26260, partial [Stenotrophomonas maltophilia]